MKEFLSSKAVAKVLRLGALSVVSIAGMSLSSCKLPSDPSRSLQTVAMFGATLSTKSSEPEQTKSAVPTAEAVTGRTGYVYSPHVAGHRLINVTKFAPGSEVRCPYTDKLFRIPDFTKPSSGPAAIAYTEVPFRNFALAEDFSATKIPMRPQPLKPTDPVAIIKRLGLDVFDMDVSSPAPDVGPLGMLPFAKNVPGSPGMVYSPFASHSQLVDVAGLMPGVEVTCPYSGKLFRVPAPLPVTAALR